MKTAAVIIVILLVCSLAYYLVFPKNTFITLDLGEKRGVVFSRTSISYQPSPDHFSKDGIHHIGPYISKLLVPSTKFKSLLIFTPDGQRGLGLDAKDGHIEVGFTVDWRKEPEKEKAIREYFEELNIKATEDYLGGNGGIPDAVRLLSYPIKGTEIEITNCVKDMLQRLCDISPTEALDISYNN